MVAAEPLPPDRAAVDEQAGRPAFHVEAPLVAGTILPDVGRAPVPNSAGLMGAVGLEPRAMIV